MPSKFIKSFDGRDIFCYLWDNVKHPKGVVQIFHGMAEHAKRYEPFAKVLNKNGYIVFADDHRAHGKTANGKKFGTYDGKDVFYDTLMDEAFFSTMLKKKYNLPLYVFGHSYGSFIAQEYITTCNEYDKIVICGSALMKGRLDVAFGRFLTWNMKLFAPNKDAKLIEKINYSSYQKLVGKGSWLNSNNNEVKKYFADPFNGKPLSNKFYYNMFKAFKRMYRKSTVNKISKTKPIFIIAGDHDPVGNMGKSVKKLYEFYNSMKLNCKLKLYEGARHEILNEPSIKEQVYDDVLSFFNSKK